jgi:hypothetical protein
MRQLLNVSRNLLHTAKFFHSLQAEAPLYDSFDEMEFDNNILGMANIEAITTHLVCGNLWILPLFA